MKLVPAPSGICGFENTLQAQFWQFPESARGGTIMQGTDLRRKPESRTYVFRI